MELLKIQRKRNVGVSFIAILLAFVVSLIVIQVVSSPEAQADDPIYGCLDDEDNPLINVYDAWFNNDDKSNGITDYSEPWYVAHSFTYRKAHLDYALTNASDPEDWIVYVVEDANSSAGVSSTSNGYPLPAWATASGGSGPQDLVGSPYTPNTQVYTGGGLNIQWWGSADEAHKMWFPRSTSKVYIADAISQSPKRLGIGIGMVRKADWPGTYNYTDQVSLPDNGPSSGSPSTPVTTGFVGVNDPDSCAFYFGEKLWNNAYTTVDEPASGVTDECITSYTSQNRHEVTQHWASDLAPVIYNDFRLDAYLDYTWCDMGNDDSSNPVTGDISEDFIRYNSVNLCWTFDNENKTTGLGGFEGVDMTMDVTTTYPSSLDLGLPAVEMDDITDVFQDCTRVDLRNSASGTGDADGGAWVPMADVPRWTIDVHLRRNFAGDVNFAFRTHCDTCYPLDDDVEYGYVNPGADGSSLVGTFY